MKLKFSFSILIILFLLWLGNLFFITDKKLNQNIIVDKLLVLKSKRQLCLMANNKIIKTYKIALGKNPVGKKEFEGDGKTPEGLYYIDAKNPKSDFYKNLGISYPNKADMEYAKRFGKSAGGAIKIHGLKNNLSWLGKLHLLSDWTMGCIAVTNKEMDEIYDKIKIGTPIEIRP